MVEKIDIIMNLDKDKLQSIVLWVLRDLLNWNTNDRVKLELRDFSGMLLEAFEYQITKAHTRQLNEYLHTEEE
jgi:hypothetical protein